LTPACIERCQYKVKEERKVDAEKICCSKWHAHLRIVSHFHKSTRHCPQQRLK
jgi:hypothetical protein